jgi:hypothetical protein
MTGLKFQVQQGIYDNKSMLDEQNFYHQRHGSPSELTKTLTYVMGSYKNKYPIATMTEGGAGFGLSNTSVELADMQFTYPVMGISSKASVVARTEYVNGDKPGVGNTRFNIYFTENRIKRQYVIQSTHGVQAYIHQDLEPMADGTYKAVAVLDPAAPSDFCPLSELQPGIRWASLNTVAAESESRTTETTMNAPGLFKNQMSLSRFGFSWAGNSANQVMKIKIKTDKGETNVWMDYAMWQYEDQWMEECEHLHWYSRYNSLPNGTISLKDELTGKVIRRGSGLLEQIVNRTTYSSLNYKAFTNKVGDMLFASSDNGNKSLTLHTGTGGKREFHQMIMAAGATLLGGFGQGNIADKFVTGTGYNLALGGYFDSLYHIDGVVIKVKYNHMFDHGRVAEASDLHPESGLPLESYRMVFIDDSDQDGQPNIQLVNQTGRAFLHGIVPGLTPMPRSLSILGGFDLTNKEAAMVISTDQDKSGYTRLKTSGIQMLNAERSIDMVCVAGLAA